MSAPATRVRRRFSVRVLRQRRHRPLGAAGPGGALVRVPVHELDETFIGTQLLVTSTCPLRGRQTVAGGLSDLLQDPAGQWCVLWVGGRRVVAWPTDVVVAEPPPTAF